MALRLYKFTVRACFDNAALGYDVDSVCLGDRAQPMSDRDGRATLLSYL